MSVWLQALWVDSVTKSFLWDKHFETGIGDVDEQHQYLVGIINQYGALISENNIAEEDVRVALFELSRYAEFHFKEEEQLMRDKGVYPSHIEQHIKVHRAFMAEVASMQSFIHQQDDGSAEQLLDFLIHWLAYHILGIDQNLARQIKAIESGLSPEEAYRQEERQRDSATEPLLNALNGLFEQVSMRNKELLKLNQSLEYKVEERTKQLLEANQRLEELSLTDALTSLPNRRSAMHHLHVCWTEAVQHRYPLVCIMIDADHFKVINDSCGHDAGDKVLIELAHELKYAFRSDDIVCRLGGDEFFVICPHTDLKGGLHIAESTRQRVSKMRVSTGATDWRGSISIGVAAISADMKIYDELIKEADNALYKAKQAGKNCVYPTM